MTEFRHRVGDEWRTERLPPGVPPEQLVPIDAFFAGLDLGQSQDYSALALLERQRTGVDTPDGRPVYHCRHLARWKLGTNYVDIGQDVVHLLARVPLAGHTQLFVDHTGVGAGVTDLMERIGLWRAMTTCQIVPGSRSRRTAPGHWDVAKVALIAAAQVALQNKRLRIAPELREAATLIRELETYQVKITATGAAQFGAWRTGEHDDLVLAVALAVWGAEEAIGEPTRIY